MTVNDSHHTEKPSFPPGHLDDYYVARRTPYSTDRVPMYFEHPIDQQANIEPVHINEVVVAAEITRGRALLVTSYGPIDVDSRQTVDPHFSVDSASDGVRRARGLLRCGRRHPAGRRLRRMGPR
jgi:hypothetical protein